MASEAPGERTKGSAKPANALRKRKYGLHDRKKALPKATHGSR